jgi:LDH2 family malate/lactate/ureidoglycolate dehydrogenase
MAIDVESFTGLDDFKQTTGSILRELRAATKQPGCERIFTAGEKEYENEKRVREQGVVIVPSLLKDVQIMISELGLHEYDKVFTA